MVIRHDNQGPTTSQEQEEMFERAQRNRNVDMIMILEARGFKVTAQHGAMDKEDKQMIALLESRGYTVEKKEEPQPEPVQSPTPVAEDLEGI